MHPPADPWDAPTEPQPRSSSPAPMYGRAAVPVPDRSPDFTLEMTAASAPPKIRPRPPKGVSWQRASRASLRSLSDGWGFSAFGVLVAFCGWGLWAAAGRGRLSSPVFGLILMLVVAGVVFVLTRLLGYIVLEQILRRRRPHARWSHFMTGLFLTAAGVSYFANTSWLTDAGDWAGSGWDWLWGWFQEQWQSVWRRN